MNRSLIILAALSLCVGCGQEVATKSTSEQSQSEATVLTKSARAESQSVTLVETFTSEIYAFKENDITPAANGVRIAEIFVEVGDKVSEGEIVATLDPTMYNQQMISVNNLRDDYERLLPVYEAGGVSRQTIDQAKSALDVQTEIAENIKKNIELISPISGVVTARNSESGDLFVNQPILHIADMSRVKVLVDISEQYFPIVKSGMGVDLSLDIYPNELFKGRVSLIYPALNPDSRTFTVEVTVPNADLKLRPGMFAHTTFNMGKKSGVMVPDIAVQKQLGAAEYYVYIAHDGKAERRRVTLGRQVGSFIDILSGVAVGDEVLTTAFSRLSDGEAITIKN